MKNTGIILSWFVLLLICILECTITLPAQAQTDSSPFITLRGKVIDQTTSKPISFASVYLENSGIGTVTNNDGEFILKVPESAISNTVTIAFMGFKSLNFKVSDLKEEKNAIAMVPQVVEIQEVIVRTNDPQALITAALKNVPENYGNMPFLCTAFYRESIMQNRTYVGVAEAVLNIYKARYSNEYESDRIKVFKGRKSQDVKRMDTVIFKLQGGLHVSLLLDIAKNPQSFMNALTIEEFNFQPVTITNIEGKQTYVVEFTPKKDNKDALYKGRIYIDVSTLAFKKVEFAISQDDYEAADNLLIIKKPFNTKVHTADTYYSVDYRDENGRWTLNHVRYQIKFKVDKKHHLFSRIYTSTVDLAITDKDTVNVTKFKYSESIKPNEIFVDHLSNYYDEDFWGPYNIIKPEEPIEDAIKRISRRMHAVHTN